MVEGISNPLNIFILGLGGGFLIPLLHKIGKPLSFAGFWFALIGMFAIAAVSSWSLFNGAAPFEIHTSGSPPPLSINLRLGPWEAFFVFAVNVVAVIGAWNLWDRLRESFAAMLLFLILTMGIAGMVMTRDLFNLFVFLEIVSIATYGLLGINRTPAATAAAFKFVIATVLASSFFLLGSVLVYHATGTLNLDELEKAAALATGPIWATGLLLILACLLIELKPFPANGWGLDVYETAPGGVAAMVSVGVSAGIFFALFKLLPLFQDQLWLVAASGGVTFLFSNLIGLRQTKVQRLLGYSSVGQMGLLTLALASLAELEADAVMPLVVGGLFANHLFAKAGLFWLAGIVGRPEIGDWTGMSKRPVLLVAFACLLVAITGLPPFPGFWAKWVLVMELAAGERSAWIAVVLVGSLLEAAYMYRWFALSIRSEEGTISAASIASKGPVLASAILLLVSGAVAAGMALGTSLWVFMPLACGAVLGLLDWLPGRLKGPIMLLLVLVAGSMLIDEAHGISGLFGVLLLAGGIVVASASLYRADARPGFHPLMAVLLLSIAALLRSRTSLEFFYAWEMVTLSSYFLIAQGRLSIAHLQAYILFSLASAFFLLAGFALAAGILGSDTLAALQTAGPEAAPAMVLLAIGFLIKAGAIGVHVWLPPAYAEADDDVSAVLSSVVSKVAVYGLFMGTYAVIHSEIGLSLARALAWIGMLTTTIAALLALQQADIKRMLAYSSVSQLGYIVTAIALMNHLGWVTALYLVANHLLAKGVLFLAAAGIILQTGARTFDRLGGLARQMPLTFATTAIALLAMSGLPPLMGFGAKWLLLSAMIDRGWYELAIFALIATFVGFLYMGRLTVEVFFGPSRQSTKTGEAPLLLLVPQLCLIAGILFLSLYPKPLIEPISRAIDPYFASTLVWGGMSLEAVYDYWNPVPMMVGAVFTSLLLWLVMLGHQRAGVSFYPMSRVRMNAVLYPAAETFWRLCSQYVNGFSEGVKKIYTGDAQTYCVYIMLYFVSIYVLSGL